MDREKKIEELAEYCGLTASGKVALREAMDFEREECANELMEIARNRVPPFSDVLKKAAAAIRGKGERG